MILKLCNSARSAVCFSPVIDQPPSVNYQQLIAPEDSAPDLPESVSVRFKCNACNCTVLLCLLTRKRYDQPPPAKRQLLAPDLPYISTESSPTVSVFEMHCM